MSVEATLRDDLRRKVADEWAEMEDRLRDAFDAEAGSEEQAQALYFAREFATEMADEYDMGDEE